TKPPMRVLRLMGVLRIGFDRAVGDRLRPEAQASLAGEPSCPEGIVPGRHMAGKRRPVIAAGGASPMLPSEGACPRSPPLLRNRNEPAVLVELPGRKRRDWPLFIDQVGAGTHRGTSGFGDGSHRGCLLGSGRTCLASNDLAPSPGETKR